MTFEGRHRRHADVPTLVQLDGPEATRRHEVETFVREAFLAAYGARIGHFLPMLMTLRNDGGRLLAALGLRSPGDQQLFLERYLDQPVEQALGTACGQWVDRKALVEVGNFAVGSAGGGRWLITALTAYLHSAARRWAVFTCGPELRNAFRRLGVDLIDLGPAEPGRLSQQEQDRWGSYYVQGPRVMAASVAQSHAVLSRLFESECALTALWCGALQAGRLAA